MGVIISMEKREIKVKDFFENESIGKWFLVRMSQAASYILDFSFTHGCVAFVLLFYFPTVIPSRTPRNVGNLLLPANTRRYARQCVGESGSNMEQGFTSFV